MALLRKKLPKYGRQLEEIAAEKAADKAAREQEAPAPQPVAPAQPEPRHLKIEELEPRITNIPIDPVLPGYVMADGTRVTDQFVYSTDGAIYPRSGRKMVSRAVEAKWGHIRRAEATLGPDPMDAYFA
jgi:hypothetical protein